MFSILSGLVGWTLGSLSFPGLRLDLRFGVIGYALWSRLHSDGRGFEVLILSFVVGAGELLDCVGELRRWRIVL